MVKLSQIIVETDSSIGYTSFLLSLSRSIMLKLCSTGNSPYRVSQVRLTEEQLRHPNNLFIQQFIQWLQGCQRSPKKHAKRLRQSILCAQGYFTLSCCLSMHPLATVMSFHFLGDISPSINLQVQFLCHLECLNFTRIRWLKRAVSANCSWWELSTQIKRGWNGWPGHSHRDACRSSHFTSTTNRTWLCSKYLICDL